MTTYDVKLPDVGEGVAEAELIEWRVQVGDTVTTESVLAEVMTDKATVEVASPVAGVVVALHGEPGDVLAVGSELVGVELSSEAPAPRPAPAHAPGPAPLPPATSTPRVPSVPDAVRSDAERTDAMRPDAERSDAVRSTGRSVAAPAVRARARALDIPLSAVTGTGPDGRVVHADLDRHLLARTGATGSAVRPTADDATLEPVRGLRRTIAERLGAAWSDIPHITYVEAVDVTDLESLRAELNRRDGHGDLRLTILPFLVRAIVLACADQPRLNATYDSTAQVVSMFDAVHVGIATQTPDGLMVPVVRHAESRGVWDIAAEISRLAGVARDGTATRSELSGSTITVTSLGALGGLVTTPIINRPEVAIVGVNKLEMRPVWRHGAFEPRQMMNLSSSFDHRIVDGWDAATFVQRIKRLLEVPALLFIDEQQS